MKRLTFFLLLLGIALQCLSVAAARDFYGNTKYPGPKARPDVGLYEVTQPDDAGPQKYIPREVDWFPRKGLDFVPLEADMPLRTWTFRPDGPRRAYDQPERFEAHLIGFRGIGNTVSNPFTGDGGPLEPAVILRLADGRKRCFVRGTFCEEDKAFIMALWLKEMDRIKATLDKTQRPVKKFNNVKFGEPGSAYLETEHFRWYSGTQQGSDDDHWSNEGNPAKAKIYRDGALAAAEYWWAFNEYTGALMPFWKETTEAGRTRKYEITIAGTKWDGHYVRPGYAGGGYGGCGIKHVIAGPWPAGLFHEWGHGMLPNGWRIGGGEAQADMNQCIAKPGTKASFHIHSPWENIFDGGMSYGKTTFYSITGDDPNWGHNYHNTLPSGADERSLFQIVARIGEQRGVFSSGVRGFGDWVGEYGARLATLDCELEDMLMRSIYQAKRCYLEVVDSEKGIYRIPYDRAPEAYGVNIIRIVPDEHAKEVIADFTGYHNPQTYSDWRACLVAVGEDKVRRYSPMKNRGKLSLARKDGDRSYFLAVTATPTAIYNGEALAEMYHGAFSPRYSWQVQLTGARPGTMRHMRAALGDSSLLCRAWNLVPEPADTPFGTRFLAELEKYRESLAQQKAAADEAQIARIEELELAVNDEIDRMTSGHRHPNGGGWVQNTATVADTAYVGPNAYVLGNAQVLDNAAIEDSAIVVDDAVVRDNAKVSGRAIISGSAVVRGYARTWVRHGGSQYTSVSKGGTPSPCGLLANYAMDGDNSYQLVDYYRFGEIGCDGYRWGNPPVVTDGKRTGFRFRSGNQYLELSQRVADLGQITVASEFKWEGAGEQTFFDFGCDGDNRFVLTTGKSGKPTLKAFVDGNNLFTLTSSRALQANTWTSLRVEIDGSKTTLWLDGKKVAELATSLRPCHVFIPGKANRNLVAMDFQGVIDNLIIYHQVNPDFEQLPQPTTDAPPIPTLAFIEELEVKSGKYEVVRAKSRAIQDELAAPYKVMTQKAEARRDELMNRDAGYVAAKKVLAAAEQAAAQRKAEIAAEVRASADGVRILEELAQTKAKYDATNKEYYAAENAMFETDDKFLKLKEQYDTAEAQRRKLEGETVSEFTKTEEYLAVKARENSLRTRCNEMRAEMAPLLTEFLNADATYVELLKKHEESEGEETRALQRSLNETRSSLANEFHRTNKIAGLATAAREKLGNAEVASRNSRSNCLLESAAYTAVNKLSVDAKKEFEDHKKELYTEYRGKSKLFQEAQGLRDQTRELESTLKMLMENATATGTADVDKKVVDATIALKEAATKARARYQPQLAWIDSFTYQINGGYYNYNHGNYYSHYAMKKLGGGEVRDNLLTVRRVYDAWQKKGDWHTEVDWDWRMKQEIDGSIHKAPQMKKWLETTRGPVK